MRDLHEAAMAAQRFADIALAHLDRPMPEELDRVKRELREALGRV